jgi:hypothetical protein
MSEILKDQKEPKCTFDPSSLFRNPQQEPRQGHQQGRQQGHQQGRQQGHPRDVKRKREVDETDDIGLYNRANFHHANINDPRHILENHCLEEPSDKITNEHLHGLLQSITKRKSAMEFHIKNGQEVNSSDCRGHALRAGLFKKRVDFLMGQTKDGTDRYKRLHLISTFAEQTEQVYTNNPALSSKDLKEYEDERNQLVRKYRFKLLG